MNLPSIEYIHNNKFTLGLVGVVIGISMTIAGWLVTSWTARVINLESIAQANAATIGNIQGHQQSMNDTLKRLEYKMDKVMEKLGARR